MKSIPLIIAAALALAPHGYGQKTTVTVDTRAGKAISPDLVGIFFEDLSYAADGGLYAELIQNRDFEYSPADAAGWQSLTAWELVKSADSKAELTTASDSPLHPNNPHYAVLRILDGSGDAGLKNSGFDGIAVKAGENYVFSVFARQLSSTGGPLTVRLESKARALLAEAKLPKPGGEWRKATAMLGVKSTDADARLVLVASGPGETALDMVSLFPEKTFKGRANGLRADLARTIADLKPKFMRFPGGCLVHGDGLGNIYNWKNTIGPIEARKGQKNIWRYHQSVGLGYFEYFQFCEDIGAMPLPVVAAGVCCQNSDYLVTRKYGVGQKGLPMDQIPAYTQDILDLIEYANGPVESTWGAKRAAAGHPAPFGLKYVGIGNEDKITPVFEERFKAIFEVVRTKHPEITVIGTVGPSPAGEDYTNGWRIASDLKVPMVDEHYYEKPEWFWNNLNRYDSYDRSKSKVYVGEYASKGNTLRNAIAEAAHLTSLERNGDIVHFASYAPLIANRLHTSWRPNLIYFNNTGVYPTISYSVQQLFSVNSGDKCLPTTLSDPANLAVSAVSDSRTGDLILKLVNGASTAKPLGIELSGVKNLSANATRTVLAGPDADATNQDGRPPAVQPQVSPITVGPSFDNELPPNSLTVIRINGRSKR